MEIYKTREEYERAMSLGIDSDYFSPPILIDKSKVKDNYLKAVEDNNRLEQERDELKNKVKILKDLLKECRDWISWAYAELYEYDPDHKSIDTEKLISHIDCAIDESEDENEFL